jgi:hypothetical protein
LEWVVENEWAWKIVGFGNLIAQGGAIMGMIFFRRPWIRFLFGLLFALETLGLGAVMRLWNWSWLLVVVIYIDWDAVLNKLRPEWSTSFQKTIKYPTKKRRRNWLFFTSLYLLLQVAIAFDPWLNLEHALKPYPISSFPMFKSINCKKPYDQHLPLYVRGNQFDHLTNELTTEQEYLLQHDGVHATRFYYRREIYDTTLVKKLILGQQKRASKILKNSSIPVRWNRDLLICPAYPDSARLKSMHRGLIAKVDANEKVKSVKLLPRGNSVDEFYLEIRQVGYDSLAILDLWAFDGSNHDGPLELDYSMKGNRIYVHNQLDRLIQVAIKVFDKDEGVEDVYFTSKFKMRANRTIWKGKVLD